MKQKLLLFVLMLAMPIGMLAQGTSWQNATQINSGATVSGTLNSDKDEAWYKIILTEEGQVSLTAEASGDLVFGNSQVYCLVGGELKNRGGLNGSWSDSTYFPATNFGKGTYYIMISRHKGSGGYTLKYTFTPCPYANDAEPDDDYQHASQLTSGKTVQGRLGFCNADNVTDIQDWYKIVVPEEGQVSLTAEASGDLVFGNSQVYCLVGGELKNRGGFNGIWSDSTYFPATNFGKGTYYVMIPRYRGSGGYTLKYTFTPCPYANDAEPDDDYQHASQLTSGKTVQGRLGFCNADNVTDIQDWYKIVVPEEGQVSLTAEASGDLVFGNSQVYCLVDGELKGRGGFNGIWSDSTYYPATNFGKGTYYIMIPRDKGSGGYTLKYTFTPCPYVNDIEPNDSYSTAVKVQNGQTVQGRLGYCSSANVTDEVDWYVIEAPSDGTVQITAKGSEDLVFGNSQVYCLVDGELKGRGGFSSLWCDSTCYSSNEVGEGTYYVMIPRYRGSGGYTLHYNFTANNYANDTEPNDSRETAMPVEYGTTFSGHLGYRKSNNVKDEYDCFKIYLNGLSSFEFLPDTTSSLVVWRVALLKENGSTVCAIDPRNGQTDLITPDNIDPGYYYFEARHNSGAGGYTVNCGKNTVYEGSNVNITFEGKNSVRLGIPSEYTVKIENTSDIPSKMFFLPVMCTSDIELLGARLPGNDGSEEYLPMDSIGNAGDSIMFFIVPPLSPHEVYSFNIIAQGLVMPQQHSIDGKKDIAFVAGSAIFIGGLILVNSAIDYVGDEVINFGTDLINDRVDLSLEELDLYRHKNANVYKDLVEEKEQTGVAVKAGKRVVKTLVSNALDVLPGGKIINFAGEVIETAGALGKALYRRFDFWIQRDLGYFAEWEQDWKAKWHGAQRGVNKVVRSWDPNEMVGPVGVGDKQYIGDTHTMDYRILFENKKEATAPAYRIRITDVLDENVFDVSSVRFGTTSHDGPGYNWKMNREGNKISWDIEGIELPPNVNAPEGEGYVTFSVNLKPGLANETQIKNKATIIFDYNEPIETNEYVNTLDLVAPTSSMVSATLNGGSVTIKCRGNDKESGVGQYYYYSIVGDGEGEFIGCGTGSEFDFEMPVGANTADYKFYALAIDEVGNIQEARPHPIGISSGLKGDVNGDGEVNISDVNAVINLILGGGSNPAADVNGDGEINIADVNAVIDIILK